MEQRIGRPLGDRCGDRTAGDVERVVPDEDVEARGVAAANLHPVDRRQRLLDRQVAGPRRHRPHHDRRGRRLRGPCAGGRCGSPTARRAAGSTRHWHAPAHRHRSRRSPASVGVNLLGVAIELIEAGTDGGDELVIVSERQGARQATQGGIDLGCSHRRPRPGRRSGRAHDPSHRRAHLTRGVARVGGRLTMAMMPHTSTEATGEVRRQ